MSMQKHPLSRWHRDDIIAPVPRYAQSDLIGLQKRYHEGYGWHNGARVTRRK